MPAEQRLGPYQEHRPAWSWELTAQCREQGTIFGLQARPRTLATQHRKLVAQHQGLDLLGLGRSATEHDQLEDAAQRQVDERPDHRHLAAEGGQATTHRSPPSSGTCWSPPRPTSGTPRGVLVTPSVEQRVSNDFSLPGQPGYEANEAIARIYGSGGHSQPIVPVVHLPAGRTVDDPRVRDGLRQAFATLSRDPGVRVASYATGGDRRFVSPDGRTTFALVFPPTHGGSTAAATAAWPPGSRR
jgi:hypothetical protein